MEIKQLSSPFFVLIGILIAAVIPAALWSHELFLFFNGLHSPWTDQVMGIISGLGDGLIIALLISCVMLFRLRLGIAAISAFLLSGLVAQMLKRLFDMPRPPAVFEDVHVLGHSLTSHSFPSGHSTSCGVMVLLAFLLWKKTNWQTCLVSALFALAAYGRIYGGVHFPIDVVVGLGIGIVSMYLCDVWSYRLPVDRWELSEWGWKVPGMILLIEAGVLGLGYHVQPSTAQALALIVSVGSLVVLMQAWKGKVIHGG
ncbi:MAG: phosphatase PAP2 family protein [Mariprofundaceae bacterium]